MRRALIAIVLAGLAAAACSAPAGESTTTSGPSGPGTTPVAGSPSGATGIASSFDPGQVRFVAALQRFDTCDALLGYFRTEALARVGP